MLAQMGEEALATRAVIGLEHRDRLQQVERRRLVVERLQPAQRGVAVAGASALVA